MGVGVDAAGQATDDGESRVGHLEAELLRALAGIVAGAPRPDDGHGVAVAFGDLAAHVEDDRRVVDLAQGGRVFVVLPGDDVGPEIRRLAHLGSRVAELFPSRNVFRQRVADTLHLDELAGACREDPLGGAEGLQESAQPHRSHARDHVERDACFAVVHRAAMLSSRVKSPQERVPADGKAGNRGVGQLRCLP